MKQVYKALTLLLLMMANVQHSGAVDVWDGETIANGFYSGNGTKYNPYTIYTASQFAYFFTQMANNGRTFEGTYIKLMNDIDMGTKNIQNLKTDRSSITVFMGDLDGGDHTLTLSSGYSIMQYYYIHYLFGTLYGKVHDIVFDNHNKLYTYATSGAATFIARIMTGGEVYNCHFVAPVMDEIVLGEGGTLANCIANPAQWKNTYKYGQASGFCSVDYLSTPMSAFCYNCDFDKCDFRNYGSGLAYNYGSTRATSAANNITCAYNGTLTPEEHNEWAVENSTPDKTYKTWPLTFCPEYPEYNVDIKFVDESGLTTYPTVNIAAGSEYTLPVPAGFDSQFLGWYVKGDLVTSVSPTDNVVCVAKWNHNMKQQPSFASPVIEVPDESHARLQWMKTAARTVHFDNPMEVTSITTSYDNMVLEFDYVIQYYRYQGRYSYDLTGYITINNENLVYVGTDDDRTFTGHIKYTFPTAGTYAISTRGATLTNMSLHHTATKLYGQTSGTLPYSYLKQDNGLYYCDVIYKNEIVHSDTLDTSTIFEHAGNYYAPTNENEVTLVSVAAGTKACTIPQAVTYDGVSYDVTAISDYAFAGNAGLESIVCMISQPVAVNASAFASVPSSLIIYVQTAQLMIISRRRYGAVIQSGRRTLTLPSFTMPQAKLLT